MGVATPGSTEGNIRTEELRSRITWVIRLRWVAAAAVAAAVSLAPPLLGVLLTRPPLYALAAALAGYNFILWAANRRLGLRPRPAALSAFANAQIGIDLLFLTALLHFSGGIENPFACYYVFHIVIASILLSRRASYAQVVLALGLLSLMAGMEASGAIAHHHLAGLMPAELYRSGNYVLAKLFVAGTTLFFTAFMATSIAAQLHRRETEVVRLSLSLQERTANLEQAYEALSRLEKGKSEYLHRVAHHLRSPLAALERMLAVVSEGRTGPVAPRAREIIDRARDRVMSVLSLARDLLALSRAREASPFVFRKQVNLAEVLSSIAGDFQPPAAQAGLTMEWDVAPQLPPIPGDPDSIAELFENLISNAVKYTPSGGRVEIRVRPQGERVEITVADSGIGIPSEELQYIFDEFYRATNARSSRQEGTGLGLTIVKAIVTAHGGEVSLESREGVGTTFRVLLLAHASAGDNPGDAADE